MYNLDYAKTLAVNNANKGTAIIWAPGTGKPAVAAVMNEDGSVKTPAIEATEDLHVDLSANVSALFYICMGKKSYLPAERALPVLTVNKLGPTPKAVLTLHYKSDTHEGAFALGLDVVFDICVCSLERTGDTEIVKAKALIDAREKAIDAKHTLADTAVFFTGKGNKTSGTGAVATGAENFMAALSA
jgi:hypothetical protein